MLRIAELILPAPRVGEAHQWARQNTALLRELDELHVYTRMIFRLLIQWLIFFLSLNWAALYVVIVTWGQPGNGSPFRVPVAVLFLIQCLLGTTIAIALRYHFGDAGRRAIFLVDASSGPDEHQARSPMPARMFVLTSDLIVLSLLSNAGAWLYVLYRIS